MGEQIMSLSVQQAFAQESAPSQESLNFRPGMALAEIERLVILETLRHQGFNRTRSARILGIGIRTLQRKLKEYRLSGLLVEAM